MIILKIVKKGYFIEIPGLPPFRTPVEANISHVSIPLVVSKLQSQGIKEFEIISDTKGKQSVLNQNDFNVTQKKDIKKEEKKERKKYEERITKLEYLLEKLLEKQASDTSSKKEQITNKLEIIEKLLKNQKPQVVHISKDEEETKPVKQKIEELDEDTFIPSINLDGLEMKGKSSGKTVKQDKTDIDDSADLLSRIIQSEK